ncbi:MAG: hypothetical protein EZS28_049338, partial [Streblomastix strix]
LAEEFIDLLLGERGAIVREDVLQYERFNNKQRIQISVRYRTRAVAEVAWQMTQREGGWLGLQFLWLDRKIILNEIKFRFNPAELMHNIMIDNDMFNENTILIDLQQKWGQDVVKVALYFDQYGQLTGGGLVTFDNTIEAEMHIISLFQGTNGTLDIESCKVKLNCQRKWG